MSWFKKRYNSLRKKKQIVPSSLYGRRPMGGYDHISLPIESKGPYIQPSYTPRPPFLDLPRKRSSSSDIWYDAQEQQGGKKKKRSSRKRKRTTRIKSRPVKKRTRKRTSRRKARK